MVTNNTFKQPVASKVFCLSSNGYFTFQLSNRIVHNIDKNNFTLSDHSATGL